jgi:FlaA1/EpsC-like NDP-sugar epimerase
LTAQGSPRAIFKRAIERGNVVVAEATAREFALTLEEALQLVLLYAAYEPAKLERAALRWYRRWLDEGKSVSLLNAQVVLAALSELRAGQPEQARALLMGSARPL